jgi:hypothetical protein
MTKDFKKDSLSNGKEVMLLIPEKLSAYLYSVLTILCEHAIRDNKDGLLNIFTKIQDPIIPKVFFIGETINKVKLDSCLTMLEEHYEGIYFENKHRLHYQNYHKNDGGTPINPTEFVALLFHYNPELTGTEGNYQLQFYRELL